MTFVIEADIPLPKRTNTGPRGSKYPVDAMEVGDSFLVDTDEAKPATVRSAVSAYCKRHGINAKFAVRVTDEGVRVWRLE